jgi:hypothetical protein
MSDAGPHPTAKVAYDQRAMGFQPPPRRPPQRPAGG